MFGHLKMKRQNRKLKRQIGESQMRTPEPTPMEATKIKEQKTKDVKEKAAESKEARVQGRTEGKAYAEDVVNRQVQGLSPQERQAMQAQANKDIHRTMQSENRKMMGQQALSGIGQKSGVAYQQSRDMQKMGQEARGKVSNQLDQLDADRQMKKMAAMFNIEQGEAAQSQLDRQSALDELNLAEERKHQQKLEDRQLGKYSKKNNAFKRI